MITAKDLGSRCLISIKKSSWFPYKTGNLKNNATYGESIDENTYAIVFDGKLTTKIDGLTGAKSSYLQYLEEGTRPHDIPYAFVGRYNKVYWYPYDDGVPYLMGTGGRFNGKFHPGSKKHKGFISNKAVWTSIHLIQSTLKEYGYKQVGRVRVVKE